MALVCEVASVWPVVWVEVVSSQASNLDSEAASVEDSEVVSEVEVALVLPVDSKAVAVTWPEDETSATTSMPTTTVLKEVLPVPEVLPLSHLDYGPSLLSQISRSLSETYVSSRALVPAPADVTAALVNIQ